jgi:hypothetical protein
MTRQMALAKVLKKYGDQLSIEEIAIIKQALKWYGEDDISDTHCDEHVTNITIAYCYLQELNNKN